MKVIEKPWGREEILEQNDKYCLKRIIINPKHRLSLQYHVKKIETIAVVSGPLGLVIDTDFGITGRPGGVSQRVLKTGDHITIKPGQIHRFCAGESEVVLYEASTPELEDVIRLEDDYKRDNP